MHKAENHGWHMHRTMRDPMADVVSFMHGCSEDPVTRVMATTALVLALCQTAGPAMISQPPGFILVNAGDGLPDPIDALMRKLTGTIRPEPRPKSEDYRRNRWRMKAAVDKKQQPQSGIQTALDYLGLPEQGKCPWAEMFRMAMEDNCGRGRAGLYADRRDEDFGWFTDVSGHGILHLDRDEDRHQLKEDIRQHPERLIHPVGYDARIREETKRLSIAGSLTVRDWDCHLASGIVRNAIPVLFLPHSLQVPLVTPGDGAIEWIGIALASEAVESRDAPVEASERIEGAGERLTRLRERLRHFPADYEFFVMRTLRELLPSCRRLVGILAPGGTPEAKQVELTVDLYDMVLQGVSLGVESLGWHGYGFENPGGHEPVQRVLRAIREHGSISKRDLQRNQQWLTAESRDAILTALVTEGLVAISGNEIAALPFRDYWSYIIRRSFSAQPGSKWKGAPRQEESAA